MYDTISAQGVRNMPQIIPIRDLKKTSELSALCRNAREPVFVTKNGYGRLVVMDIEHYERTVRKMHEAKLVNESLDDISSGTKLTPGDEIKQKIMKKYGK